MNKSKKYLLKRAKLAVFFVILDPEQKIYEIIIKLDGKIFTSIYFSFCYLFSMKSTQLSTPESI